MNSIAFSPSGRALEFAIEAIQFQSRPHEKLIGFAIFHEPNLKGFRVENRLRVAVRCFFHGSNHRCHSRSIYRSIPQTVFHTYRLTGHTFP